MQQTNNKMFNYCFPFLAFVVETDLRLKKKSEVCFIWCINESPVNHKSEIKEHYCYTEQIRDYVVFIVQIKQ